MKRALITGITGQISSYMAEYLLNKGYEVHGLNRRKSIDNFDNILLIKDKIKIIEGDLIDPFSLATIITNGQYHSVYNLAAMSHVHTSFEQPRNTFEVNAVGVLNLLEAIRNFSPQTKLYQASTSELYGSTPPPQNENTRFHPRSPYGVSKLAAHYLVVNYHESYKLKCACGIMFNSESARRGVNFVTRKITEWVIEYYKIFQAKQDFPEDNKGYPYPVLELGNLDSKRDWLLAYDSVDAIYKICNQDEYNKDFNGVWKSYCFGSGKAHSVRDFLKRALELAFDCKFDDRFKFEGSGISEKLLDKVHDNVIMKINEKFYRPAEVDFLQSNPELIKKELGWKPKYDLDNIIFNMLYPQIPINITINF